MTQLKNIVFDFGGVLIDWNPEYLYKKVFEDKAQMEHFLNNVCTYSWNVLQDAGRPVAVGRVGNVEVRGAAVSSLGAWYALRPVCTLDNGPLVAGRVRTVCGYIVNVHAYVFSVIRI